MKLSYIALSGCAVLALAGCGDSEPAATPTTTTSPAATTTTADDGVKLSQRGNVIKQPGETGIWGLADRTGELTFVVDNLAVTDTCRGGDQPENGAYLIFDLRVTTPAGWPTGHALFHRSGYTVVGSDGVTTRNVWQGNSISCDDFDGQWSEDLEPGSTYRGKVVLDVPPGVTVLAFNPTEVDSRGFEWPIPAAAPKPVAR